MMTNNFPKLSNLMSFESEDDFYVVEIFKKSDKLNPLKFYKFESVKDLNLAYSEIVDLCSKFDADAWIYMNKRSFEQVGRAAAKLSVEYVSYRAFSAISNAYHMAMRSTPNPARKTWTLQVDGRLTQGLYVEIENFMRKNARETDTPLILCAISVGDAYHMLVPQFVADNFDTTFENVKILRDSPTLLFRS